MTATTGVSSIARLKVVLAEVEPKVVRRLEVPAGLRLDRLHLVLQEAVGWTNSHLHEFRFGKTGFGVADPAFDHGDGPRDEKRTTLIAALEETGARGFTYLYDFGDGWEHLVEVESLEPAAEDVTYPRLVEASGRCPPEDVGGPWGYAEFLEAMVDPGHERHAEKREWWGETFDTHEVDVAAVNQALKRLEARWNRARRPKT